MLTSSRPARDPVPKQASGMRTTAEVVLWPSHTHTVTCTHENTHTGIHIYLNIIAIVTKCGTVYMSIPRGLRNHGTNAL